MSENDNIQKYVQQYIQDKSTTDTRETITQNLIAVGYSINDVDEAYETLGLGWDDESMPDVLPAHIMLNKGKDIKKYLRDYIQKNRETYKRLDIEYQLLEAGYSMGDIDIVYEDLGLGSVSEWKRIDANPIGFLVFFPVIPIFVYILHTFILELNFILFSYLVVFFVGTFLPMVIKHINPSLAKGMKYGFRALLVLFLCLPAAGLGIFWSFFWLLFKFE